MHVRMKLVHTYVHTYIAIGARQLTNVGLTHTDSPQ